MNQQTPESLFTAATQTLVGAAALHAAPGTNGAEAQTETVLEEVLAVAVETKVRLGSDAASCVQPASAHATE